MNLCAIFIFAFCIYTPLLAAESEAAQSLSLNSVEIEKTQSITLSIEETAVLENFFHALICQSEGGYVLFGKKPVCVHGYWLNCYDGWGSDSNQESAFLQEGAELWKRISKGTESNLLIHIYDRPDSVVKNCVHVLVIDKKLFCETVQQNLALFQYVLGPSVTPLALLHKLTDPNETFHGVLQNDKVLIGILLGFGVQNALHVSRLEQIQEGYIAAAEQFPLKNKCEPLAEWLGHYRSMFLLNAERSTQEVVLNPTFSYSSVSDEIIDLIKKVDVGSSKLSERRPWYIFGRLKDGESDQLVHELEAVQEQIIKLLSTPEPLALILKEFLPDKHIVVNGKPKGSCSLTFTQKEYDQLFTAVCKNCCMLMESANSSYVSGFFRGMHDAQIGKQNHEDPVDLQKLKVLKIAKDNVEEANRFFMHLNGKDAWQSTAEGMVYYRSIKPGSGSPLNRQQLVTLHCKAITPNGDTIRDTWHTGKAITIDLQESIPGFAWGMQGMKVGEIRELVIHPASGYGLYTTLDKGIYLKATVELLAIAPSANGIPFDGFKPHDFTRPFNFLAKHDMSLASKTEGYLTGYAIWEHYKKGNPFKTGASALFTSVLARIKFLNAATNEQDKILTESDQRLINRLNWNIYSSQLKPGI